jgi:nucleoside-diphosphate kinase
LLKEFTLKYYPNTHEADMTDIKSHRLFLKRSKLPATVSRDDFVVGGKVIIYGRELSINDYADPNTRNQLDAKSEACAMVCGPASFASWGKAVSAVERAGGVVLSCKTVAYSGVGALEAAEECACDANDLSGGVSLVVQFRGANVTDAISGACGGSPNCYPLSSMSSLVTDATPTTATFDSCTCCVLKPHTIKSGNVGDILHTLIEQGYDVSAVQSFSLSRAAAAEFLTVYKTVVTDFTKVVDEFAAGLVVAVELRAEEAVQTFRKTAGPWDVEIAQELFPRSIRGKYGVDGVRNAVHCTDLDSDGVSECEYFFSLLQ